MKIGAFSKKSSSTISKLAKFNNLTNEKFQRINQKFTNCYINQGIDVATKYLISLIEKYGTDIVCYLAINHYGNKGILENSETAKHIHLTTNTRIGKDMLVIVAKLYNENIIDDHSLTNCLPFLRNYCTIDNLVENFPRQNKIIINYVLAHFDSFATNAIFDKKVEAFNYCNEWRKLFIERFKKVYIQRYNVEYIANQLNHILKIFPELIIDMCERNFLLIIDGKFQHDFFINHSKSDSKAALLLENMADIENNGIYHFDIVRSKKNIYNFFANCPYYAFTDITHILENRFGFSVQTINNILKKLFETRLNELLENSKFDMDNRLHFNIFITMLKFEHLHVLLDEYIPAFLSKYGFKFFANFSMYVGMLPDILKMQYYYCDFESISISTFI